MKIALVTGASRGIGRAVARELARRNYHVIAVARSAKALESLDDEISAEGGAATLVPFDLKDYDAIDRLGGVIYERWGKLDALVGNAGHLGELMPIFDAHPKMVEEVFATNVLANQRLIRSLDRLLRTSEAGRAVFLTSGVTKSPRQFWGVYGASKAALETLVLTYAAETAITKMKVNLVDPGPVKTLMRQKAYPGDDPAKPPEPETVAPAICDLVAPDCMKHGEIVRLRG